MNSVASSRVPGLVSVVVPTHNRAALLIRALDSILGQTYTALEAIVVDDGSTDGTRERLADVRDCRVRVLSRSASGRPSIPRNQGIRAAQGEFVAFCDSDDIWYPQKLEAQVAFLQREQDLAFVSASCQFTGLSNIRWPESIPEATYRELVRKNFVACSTVVVRRDILDEVGLFDESSDLTVAEDWDLWLRIAKGHRFAVLPDTLVEYMVHAGSTSQDREKELRGLIAVRKRLLSRDPSLELELKKVLQHLERDLKKLHLRNAPTLLQQLRMWLKRSERA